MARGETGFASDILNGVGAVLDFLGAGVGGDALKAAAGKVEKANAEAAAMSIYDDALGQCVTEGQMGLMEGVGAGAFVDCLEYALDNEAETGGFLSGQTDHPEAIGEILEGAEEEISQIAESMLGDDGTQITDSES